ncbi:MAG: hypothetical protein WC966_02850 [Bradymonadales bacterium]|jgi:hypothetical protein
MGLYTLHKLGLCLKDTAKSWHEDKPEALLVHESDSKEDPYILRVTQLDAYHYYVNYENWRMKLDTLGCMMELVETPNSLFPERYIFERIARPLFAMLHGSHLAIHASALSIDERAFAFLGSAFSGKSTLALKALSLCESMKYYSDDLLNVCADGRILPSSTCAYLRNPLHSDWASEEGLLFGKLCYAIDESRLATQAMALSDLVLLRRGEEFSLSLWGVDEMISHFMRQVLDFSPGTAPWRRHRFGLALKVLRAVERCWCFTYPERSAVGELGAVRDMFVQMGAL